MAAQRTRPAAPLHSRLIYSGLDPSRPGLGLRAFARLGLGLALAFGFCLPGALARPETEPLQFQEVYELLKTKLAGTSEQELNRAAVRGLLDQLSGKVTVVGDSSAESAPSAKSALVSASVFEGKFAYVRLSRLTADTDREFESVLAGLRATNSLKGLVLDLRFTSGQDYGAAVAIADRFLSTEEPLVDWGEGWKKSKGRTDALSYPLAVLVNRRTSGAGEVLAGILRYRDVGLLIGTNTAGQASMAQEFTLKTGQRLRVAIAPVKVADGRELPFTGIQPDISIDTTPEEELAWYADAFKPAARSARPAAAVTNDLSVSAAGTNRASRRRLNEAELVRMSREGQGPEREPLVAPTPQRPAEAPPVVVDPALTRALDLLKGLAVVQSAR